MSLEDSDVMGYPLTQPYACKFQRYLKHYWLLGQSCILTVTPCGYFIYLYTEVTHGAKLINQKKPWCPCTVRPMSVPFCTDGLRMVQTLHGLSYIRFWALLSPRVKLHVVPAVLVFLPYLNRSTTLSAVTTLNFHFWARSCRDFVVDGRRCSACKPNRFCLMSC